MTKKERKIACMVAGDYVLDHHIYQGRRYHFGDHRHRGVHEVEELGGAALVHYLLEALGGGVDSYSSVAVDNCRKPVMPADRAVPPELCSYAVWRAFGTQDEASLDRLVWRTRDAMGFGGRLPMAGRSFQWPASKSLPQRPQVVAVSDGGMGFRSSPSLWPKDGVLEAARWIVLKTSEPLVEGPLWQHLAGAKFASKLVVVVSSTALRKSEARISTGLSWDATVQSVLDALASGGELEGLVQCRHLLLSFGIEGGLWLDLADPARARVHLVYEASTIEGDRCNTNGGMAFGSLSCLAAAAAWHLARAEETPDLEAALEGGHAAMRDLLENGHGPASAEGRGYPAERLAEVIGKAADRYARTVFPAAEVSVVPDCPVRPAEGLPGPCWSIVHGALRRQGQPCPEPAWDLAEQVARRGPVAMASLPHLSIGKLMSVDPWEIETLRGLRRLIREYRERSPVNCKTPLSIGVFGPPGAGKSFAVKEIARTLVGSEGWMEFNLSQFKPGTDDLIGAYHQIRDRVLRNQIPVAFFDEFDSREYGWLQYLLAPMQDGAFQEGQITHAIGKCLFIFAGGTSQTFTSFGPPPADTEAYSRFRLAKGPDFKSRLDGFLDVRGPNRRDIVSLAQDGRSYREVADPCDIFFPVRRALVMRSELGCEAADKLAIDNGLLRALLRTGGYIHGARSMSKVLNPLKQARPGMIRRSQLPSHQQLALHLDADEFLDLCRQTPATGPVAELESGAKETMAKAIHEVWRKLGKQQGWIKPGVSSDRDYASLSDHFKDSNRAAAERMIRALSVIGLALEPGSEDLENEEWLRLKIEHNLELLAEAEHDGWVAWHLDQGWQWGAVKDEAKKTHPCIQSYLKLSHRERNKDRNTVRHYPHFATRAGMRIVSATS